MTKAPTGLPPFLERLGQLVQTCPSAIGQWASDGASFEVKNGDRFEKEVIPRYFSTSAIKTFIRQLHFYSFRKSETIDGKWSFSHPDFHRDFPERIFKIKRKTRNTASTGYATKYEVQVIADSLDEFKVTIGQQVDSLQAQMAEVLQFLHRSGYSRSSSGSSGCPAANISSGSNQPQTHPHHQREASGSSSKSKSSWSWLAAQQFVRPAQQIESKQDKPMAPPPMPMSTSYGRQLPPNPFTYAPPNESQMPLFFPQYPPGQMYPGYGPSYPPQQMPAIPGWFGSGYSQSPASYPGMRKRAGHLRKPRSKRRKHGKDVQGKEKQVENQVAQGHSPALPLDDTSFQRQRESNRSSSSG